MKPTKEKIEKCDSDRGGTRGHPKAVGVGALQDKGDLGGCECKTSADKKSRQKEAAQEKKLEKKGGVLPDTLGLTKEKTQPHPRTGFSSFQLKWTGCRVAGEIMNATVPSSWYFTRLPPLPFPPPHPFGLTTLNFPTRYLGSLSDFCILLWTDSRGSNRILFRG